MIGNTIYSRFFSIMNMNLFVATEKTTDYFFSVEYPAASL